MKKRVKKSDKLYYVVLRKDNNSVVICNNKQSIADYTGISRSTLYRCFLSSNIFINDKYTIWCNVVMYICNKEGNL